MDRKTFEQQKAYAGERQPSMKRRCLDCDYSQRGMYMVTLVTEGRRKLFGDVKGRSEAEPGSADAPRMMLSELGESVVRCWQSIPEHYPEIKLIKLQMMPDHLHGILFVQREMDNHLGIVLKGFKTGCNKEYRKMIVGCVATVLQHTGQQQKHTGHEEGLLFERNYNDRLLLREGQLQRWIDYLDDNPRRLLAKREHPDLFRVHFGLQLAGQTYAAIGNRFLLQRPWKLQVQCSRSLTKDEIDAKVDLFLSHARQGAVLVSPAISEGEKAVMRAALEARLPLIFLSPNNITPFTKPGGAFIEACSRGDLLILAPWPDHSATQPLTRQECLTLNKMAETICEQ
jgi:REP element-mobilizing transposase RayT